MVAVLLYQAMGASQQASQSVGSYSLTGVYLG